MSRFSVFMTLAAVVLCGAIMVSCKEKLEADPVAPDRGLPYQLPDWMSMIDDDKYLSEITIPGTHDSGADLHTSEQGTESKYTITQNFRLSNQLLLGVRWFDIRLGYDSDGGLSVHHANYYLHKNFTDLLDAAEDFLSNHPTEVVIFMVKQETWTGHKTASDHDFQQAVMSHIWGRTNWQSRYYLVPGRVPKMSEVRGKIVLVRQYDNALNVGNPGIKFKWDENTTGGYFTNEGITIFVQDHYKLATVSYGTKCDQIKDCVRKAHAETDPQKFNLNFTSGEQDLNHYLETIASSINPEIDDWLMTPQIYRKCGIIMVNYAGGSDDGEIGDWFVYNIIQCNDLQVKLGNQPFQQTWQARNLDVDHYRNGDPIPFVTDPSTWQTLTTGAYCYYGNDPGHAGDGNGAVYGKLYNWYAVHDPRGLAPTGWHVAGVGDWTILIDFNGGWSAAGGKLKSTGYWWSPNTGATDEFCFSARPAGERTGNGGSPTDPDVGKGEYGKWWTSDEASGTTAKYLWMGNFTAAVTQSVSDKSFGYSVRCVKD
jgi:uncharacterized protein (TIGR02145 family)